MVSILRSHPISSKPWSSRFSSRARPKGPRGQGMDVQPSPCGGHVHSFVAGQARPGLLASTHVEDIVAEANHMADLANNLLTLARLDSRSSHQEHEVVRVASLAEAGAQRVQALAGQT